MDINQLLSYLANLRSALFCYQLSFVFIVATFTSLLIILGIWYKLKHTGKTYTGYLFDILKCAYICNIVILTAVVMFFCTPSPLWKIEKEEYEAIVNSENLFTDTIVNGATIKRAEPRQIASLDYIEECDFRIYSVSDELELIDYLAVPKNNLSSFEKCLVNDLSFSYCFKELNSEELVAIMSRLSDKHINYINTNVNRVGLVTCINGEDTQALEFIQNIEPTSLVVLNKPDLAILLLLIDLAFFVYIWEVFKYKLRRIYS